MMLYMKEQQAKNLKKIVGSIVGVGRFARMTPGHDGLFLEAMNSDHSVSASLVLGSLWFSSYNFAGTGLSGSDENSGCNWTTVFDLHAFNRFVSMAGDDDPLDIFVFSDVEFNCFHFVVDTKDGGFQCHEMEFKRTGDVDVTTFYKMENAYANGFKVAMPPHHLTHILRRSLASQQPVYLDVTSSMTMVSSGPAMCFLEKGSQCVIENFPEGGFFSLQLPLNLGDYFL